MDDWGRFDEWLLSYLVEPESRASVISASLTASLELARDGRLEIRQEGRSDFVRGHRSILVGTALAVGSGSREGLNCDRDCSTARYRVHVRCQEESPAPRLKPPETRDPDLKTLHA